MEGKNEERSLHEAADPQIEVYEEIESNEPLKQDAAVIESHDDQQLKEEEVAGASSTTSIKGANSKLSTAQSNHVSDSHMPTDPDHSGLANAQSTNGASPKRNARRIRGAIDTTRAPLSTPFCGRIVRPTSKTVRVPPSEMMGYRFRCPICKEALREQRAVFAHFPGCVRRNGNPTGARWYDHASIDLAKIPNSLRIE